MHVGAQYQGDHRCEFRVWAPQRQQVSLLLEGAEETPREVPLSPAEGGYWQAVVEPVAPGSLYRYRLDGDLLRPDPASQSQPQDVHGPSQVVDHSAYSWQDASWRGVPLRDYIIYELHIGTFTEAGTFVAAIEQLDPPSGARDYRR